MIAEWLDAVLSAKWLTSIFELFMQVVMVFVGILLYPISVVIKRFFPAMDDLLSYIPQAFDYALTYMGWVLNSFAVPTIVIVGLVGYYTFVLSARFSVFTFKLALKWYRAIK